VESCDDQQHQHDEWKVHSVSFKGI